MDSTTAVLSSDTSSTSAVRLFLWVLAQVCRVVSRRKFLLSRGSSSDHWIEREIFKAFLFFSKFFRERKCHLNTEQRLHFRNRKVFQNQLIPLSCTGKKLYKDLHVIFTLSLLKNTLQPC